MPVDVETAVWQRPEYAWDGVAWDVRTSVGVAPASAQPKVDEEYAPGVDR